MELFLLLWLGLWIYFHRRIRRYIQRAEREGRR